MRDNRLQVYKEMIDLCQQYMIEMTTQDSWNENSFQQFEEKWNELKRIVSSISSEARSEGETEEELIHCQSLFVLYQSIIDRTERQRNQLATQVQGVRQSKTIMNAYHGMGRMDQIAYYFDEKK
ncbi:flagellar protein FliT [Paenibacillus thiaminolyticus]|uniref:flagellar protein FliT n=1 Tax=Paenibacillus TaxID=44249 RepID=UPI0010595953|nr:flagellar protein FliT [Paenibacillus dendritiformis]TDL51799.1 flagellar protein FliT [Paenibacillus dendritiformis]